MLGGLFAIGILAFGGVYLTGAFSQGEPAPEPVPPMSEASSISMRLMGGFGPELAGEMVAERAGLFRREGLQVELRESVDSEEAIAAVASGADVIGVARADSFLEARGKGAPIVAFAASFIESPVAFYVLKSSGLRGAQDFAAKRIGRRAGDDTEVSFEALETKLHLPRSTMRETPVGSDVSVLINGNVDVWPGHVGKDDYVLSARGIDFIAISPGGYGVHLPGSVYFASEQTIRERPRLIQSFVKSVIAGWELAYANASTSAAMIASFAPKNMTPDSVRFALDHQRDSVRPIAARFCEFDEGHWRSLQETLLGQRLLDQPLDLSLAVTYQFLNEAYRKPYSFGK
jgi:ABC-type nitrate/sulfonate/bicarbonate transport system substrate-binding protein